MATSTPTKAIVLAAGRGTRFEALSDSKTPKLLQPISGRPVLVHVIDHVKQAGADSVIVVIGHKGDEIRAALEPGPIFVTQHQQLGSGSAVAVALEALPGFSGSVLIMCGDSPLIQPRTIRKMLQAHADGCATATLLVAILDDPTGYGRIVRAPTGRILSVVEEKSAEGEQLRISEVNGGAYVFDAAWLSSQISHIPVNAAGEINLTGAVEMAAAESRTIATVACEPEEILGVNIPAELERARLLLTDFARSVCKRKELLEDGRQIVYYDFQAGLTTSSIRADGKGAAGCPN